MNRIKELRLAAGMSQEDLGHRLNVGKGAVSRYELEKRQLDPVLINTLCGIFDCSADYLLCRTEIKKPALTDDEFRLVEAFRAADPDLQDLIRRNLKMNRPEDKKAVS